MNPSPSGPVLAAEINALPERLRRYVHDLEQRADPAGDVRRAFVAEENAIALNNRVLELERYERAMECLVMWGTITQAQADHALRVAQVEAQPQFTRCCSGGQYGI